MSFEKILSIIFIVAYLALLFVGAVSVFIVYLEKRKARSALRDSILKKIENNISLSLSDVTSIAKGVNLQRPSVSRTIYKLLHDTNEPTLFQKFKELSKELEKEEPFDDLPEEVKPSLVRLSELCTDSHQKSDQFLLTPIQKTLATYVELKIEVEKTKKWSKLFNTLGIVSFIVGLLGFYLTLKSPDIKDIEAAVNRVVNKQVISNVNPPQQSEVQNKIKE